MNQFLKKSTLYSLLAATISMIGVMYFTGQPLKTLQTTSGILNLEFANTKQKTDDILAAWKNASPPNKDIIAAAKINTYFDFLFLIYYAFFLYACCKQLAISMSANKTFNKWLNKFAVLALLAGLLDFFENIGMLFTLFNSGSDTIALATSAISICKWALVFAVLILIIMGLASKLIVQIRKA